MDTEAEQHSERAQEAVPDDGRRNRLPTFTEVLARKTRPPVDLFMF